MSRDPRRLVARAIDTALETTIVGSFSGIGYQVRSRLEQWDDLPRLDGQTAVVTGGSSGIGLALGNGLARLGASVCLTSRSADRAAEIAGGIDAAPNQRIVGLGLDVGSTESIEAFAADVANGFESIDILINNAGALLSDYQTNDDGTEVTLATHLLGPYRLSSLLRPSMTHGGRLLFMSSGGMYSEALNLDTLEMTRHNYDGTKAYARAKRAQVELVRHLGPKWAPELIVHSVHPGWVDTPGVDEALPGFAQILGPILREPDQGADTALWLAATGGNGADTGLFWHDRRPRGISYIPGTSSTDTDRHDLVEWIEQETGISTD